MYQVIDGARQFIDRQAPGGHVQSGWLIVLPCIRRDVVPAKRDEPSNGRGSVCRKGPNRIQPIQLRVQGIATVFSCEKRMVA